MEKDPAFLFYSKDFYEGTRTMLPEERACYIDLLIYQHQNEKIPLDLKRVLLYCNGINEATLQATLQAKFKQTDNGWINTKLTLVNSKRGDYSSKQSMNGTVGQFWKKSKLILSNVEFLKLREFLKNESIKNIFDKIENQEISLSYLKAMLKHLENENEIVDVIEIKDKDKNDIAINKKPKINFEEIVSIFNSVCFELPKVTKIIDSRKKAIALILQKNTLEELEIVFKNISESDYLNGKVVSWKADFDWILKPENFIKILENKYINNGKSNTSSKPNYRNVFTSTIDNNQQTKSSNPERELSEDTTFTIIE